MNAKIQKAKSLLVHYFRLTMEEAGAKWSYDCITEIEDIVDLLVAGIREEIQSTTVHPVHQEAPNEQR